MLAFLGQIAQTDISEYIYPYRDPSFSNYGTVGLIQMPSARFYEEGSVAFSWSHNDPYLRGSVVAYPFRWLEASFQYADINNTLYSDSPAFSGSQSLKDKSFDAKFRILRETNYFPSIAVGFRDLAGTGLFSGEYIVASKLINNFDFSIGAAWGVLSRQKFKNPFSSISNRFKTRTEFGERDSKGGEFSLDSYFRGNADLFLGIEYFIPNLNGARFKIEYDTTNYSLEGPKPVPQDSNFNYGFVFPVNKFLYTKIGYTKGNTLNFGFSMALKLGKNNPVVKKTDRKWKDPNAEIIKRVASRDDELLYKVASNYLNENEIFLQHAQINGDTLKVGYTQSKYRSFPLATGRAVNVLNQVMPDKIKYFELVNLNADMPLHSIMIDRKAYTGFESIRATNALLARSILAETNPGAENSTNFEFNPESDFPILFSKFYPNLRSQIGGPDGFFFGDLTLTLDSELFFTKQFTVSSVLSTSLYNNFGDLKLASNSVLPHVRTDIVQYLKESSGKPYIERMHFNYYKKISNSIYGKITGGYLESMFGGIGGELLYRPFTKNFAIGIDAFHVKQRAYDMGFEFQDYETITGHASFYYREPNSNVQLVIKGGRFLAKDSGFNFDLAKLFKSGVQMGIFFSKTDISSDEFGEGSFDKGFYFHFPLDIFTPGYQSQIGTWGLRPITRDGAAMLAHAYNLWGVTWAGSRNNLDFYWDDFYD